MNTTNSNKKDPADHTITLVLSEEKTSVRPPIRRVVSC